MQGTNVVMTVTNGTKVAVRGGETWTVNQLAVASNSTVTCFSTNNTGMVSGVWAGTGVVIRAQSVLVHAGGAITADGLGYSWHRARCGDYQWFRWWRWPWWDGWRL